MSSAGISVAALSRIRCETLRRNEDYTGADGQDYTSLDGTQHDPHDPASQQAGSRLFMPFQSDHNPTASAVLHSELDRMAARPERIGQ